MSSAFDYCELRVFIPTHGMEHEEYEDLVASYKTHLALHNDKIKASQYKDAGFDLIMPRNQTFTAYHSKGTIVDLQVRCSMYYTEQRNGMHGVPETLITPQSYFLCPRSSTGTKTPLRLANSIGIIDAGYRGNIKACVDCNNFTFGIPSSHHEDVKGTSDFTLKKKERYFQICSPNLKPILVTWVNQEAELNHDGLVTERNYGGFGST